MGLRGKGPGESHASLPASARGTSPGFRQGSEDPCPKQSASVSGMAIAEHTPGFISSCNSSTSNVELRSQRCTVLPLNTSNSAPVINDEPFTAEQQCYYKAQLCCQSHSDGESCLTKILSLSHITVWAWTSFAQFRRLQLVPVLQTVSHSGTSMI